MPPFDEAVAKKQIADGKIGALSLDTSIFDKVGRNLDSQPLISLAQFRHGPTRLVISEVVIGELKAHITREAAQAKQELAAKLRGIGKHWHRPIDVEAMESSLGIGGEPSDFADAFVASFQDNAQPVIVGVESVEPNELLRRYLAHDPPFGEKEAKKREFPDALALIALEAWARNAKTWMLVVSGDQGWKDFCRASEHLYCMDELPPALNLFNEDVGVVVRRALAMLRAGEAQDLHDAISSSIEGYLENSELDGDAESFIEVEVDYVEPTVKNWEIRNVGGADVISSDDDTVVFSVLVTAEIEFDFHLLFRRWDKEDREYMRMGSRTVSINDERAMVMTIVIARNIDPEPEVIEITYTPERIFLEIGDVDPFDC